MIKNKARWAEPPYALTKKGSVPALCLVHVLFATVVQLGHTLLGFGSWAVRSLKFLSHGRYIGSPATGRRPPGSGLQLSEPDSAGRQTGKRDRKKLVAEILAL